MTGAVRAHPRTALAIGACALFLLAAAAVEGGLVRGGHYGDTSLYARDAHLIVHDGLVPYRDFTLEYPPGSLAAFLPPAVSSAHYTELFRVLMALCGLGALVLSARLLADRPLRAAAVVLGAAALAPLAFGPILLNEYDLWPVVLTLGALAAFVDDRSRLGGVLLGLGAATKIFPLAILPAALVWIDRRSGRRAALVALGCFAAAVVVLYGAFAAFGPGGVWFSIHLQLHRGLQKESLGAAVLYVLDQLGLYKAHIVEGNASWTELTGRAGDALAGLSSALQAVVALAAAYLVARRRPDRDTLLLGAAAAVTGFVAFGKVFSPQYLVWLVPLVLLVSTVLEGIALAGAIVVTQLWFLEVLTPFDLGPQVWLVVARDAALVGLLASLLLRLRARELAAPRREPRRAPPEAGSVPAGPT